MTKVTASEIVQKLVTEYRAGASTVTLGKKYGLSPATVAGRLAAAGVVRRPAGRHKTEIPVGTRFGQLVTTGETFIVERFGLPMAHVPTLCTCGMSYVARVHGLRSQGQVSCGCHAWKVSDRKCELPNCNEKHFGLGFCRGHYRELVQEDHNAAHREWMRAHPEEKRAYKARRRYQARHGLNSEDLARSIEYRKVIANDSCFYCGAPGEHDDHFFPLAKGGTDTWFNLVRACRLCNQHKHDRCGTWFLLRRSN
jgi:5-methylcytosine-specific restriction endonuclease McrA